MKIYMRVKILIVMINFIALARAGTQVCQQLLPVGEATGFSFPSITINKNCQALAVWAEQGVPAGQAGIHVNGAIFNGVLLPGAWNPVNIEGRDGFEGAPVAGEGISSPMSVDIDCNGEGVLAYYSKSLVLPGDFKGPLLVFTFSETFDGPFPVVSAVDQSGDPLDEIGIYTLRSGDMLYVIWYSNPSIDPRIQYAVSTNGGEFWTSHVITANSKGKVLFAKSDNKQGLLTWLIQDAGGWHIQAAKFGADGVVIPSAQDYLITAKPGKQIAVDANSKSSALNNQTNGVVVWSEFTPGITDEGTLYGAFCKVDGCTRMLLKDLNEQSAQAAASIDNNNNGLVVASATNGFLVTGYKLMNNMWHSVDTSNITNAGTGGLCLCGNDQGNGALGLLNEHKISYFFGGVPLWSALLQTPCIVHNAVQFSCTSSPSNAALISERLETAVCCDCDIPASIDTPLNLQGVCTFNRFPLQGERFAALSWEPSAAETEAGYIIFRDNIQIASLPATQLAFEDHNLSAGPVTYGVSTVNAAGVISAPAYVALDC